MLNTSVASEITSDRMSGGALGAAEAAPSSSKLVLSPSSPSPTHSSTTAERGGGRCQAPSAHPSSSSLPNAIAAVTFSQLSANCLRHAAR